MAKIVRDEKINVVKLAYLYFREGRWDNAIEEYRKLLELEPEDVNVYKMLGDVYVRKNDHAQAYEEYSKVAAHFIDVGQTDKAALIQEKINRLDQNRLPAAVRQKQLRIQLQKKTDEALSEHPRGKPVEDTPVIVKLDSDETAPESKLEKIEEESGQFSDPVERYSRLGETFFEGHLFKKAMEMFKKVSALDPQNRMARVRLAQIYAKTGMENEAKKEYLNAAGQALAQDDLEHAFEYANKAVELKSIEAHYVLGVVLFKRRQWAEAREKLDTLLRFKVNHIGAQIYLARVFDGMNQPDKAVENFQKALKLDKDSVLALEAWAEYCSKREHRDEAIKTFTGLIDKAAATGDKKRAVELTRKLVAVDVTRVPSKLKLARLLQSVGDLNGAADVYYHLALWSKNQNKVDEASQYMQKTLELNPEHVAALEMAPKDAPRKTTWAEEIVLTYQVLTAEPVAASMADPSAETSARGAEVSPGEAFDAQMGIADQYVHQGLLAEAIGIYQQLLDSDPGNSEVIRKINGVYGAYAKTGTDLTEVLAAAPPVDEATRKSNVAAGKKKLGEIELKARVEADVKMTVELEKNSRATAKREKLDRARSILKELAAEAVDLADKKMRGEAKSFSKTNKSLPVVSVDTQGMPIASETPRPVPTPVDTIFLKVGGSSFSTTWSTVPQQDPNVRKKMKKIGFV